jgi:hypothetical protein
MSLLCFLNHFYGLRPAFLGAYPASLAIKFVRPEIAVLLLADAEFRAKQGTDTAFNAFFVIPNGML